MTLRQKRLDVLKQHFIVDTAPPTGRPLVTRGRRLGRVPPKTCVDRLEWLTAEIAARMTSEARTRPVALVRFSRGDLLLFQNLLRWCLAASKSARTPGETS